MTFITRHNHMVDLLKHIDVSNVAAHMQVIILMVVYVQSSPFFHTIWVLDHVLNKSEKIYKLC